MTHLKQLVFRYRQLRKKIDRYDQVKYVVELTNVKTGESRKTWEPLWNLGRYRAEGSDIMVSLLDLALHENLRYWRVLSREENELSRQIGEFFDRMDLHGHTITDILEEAKRMKIEEESKDA